LKKVINCEFKISIIAKQILDGLNFMHSKKVVHGNLSSRKIFVTEKSLILAISGFGNQESLFKYTGVKQVLMEGQNR
jgi:serine/threonine protein kinase